MRCALLLSLLALGAPLLGARSAADIRGHAPVSVSSANYRTHSRAELREAIELAGNVLNPKLPELKAAEEPQAYVFVTGEVAESDLSFEQVTDLLQPALEKKGYHNAADKAGLIRDPKGVKLVLRVNYGKALWRLPTVRTDRLTWADGMVPKNRDARRVFGAELQFDSRAGGNDDIMNVIARNDASDGGGMPAGWGGSGGGGASGGASVVVPDTSNANVEYGGTREFNLIVVDAFEYQELLTKKQHARRVWSTFVAAPAEPKQKFSDVASMLVRNAAPFFGETMRGLQVYNDARAEVKIGELVEVDENGEPKK